MDQKGRMEKENKTLGTGRCENIDTLYIHKIIIIIIIISSFIGSTGKNGKENSNFRHRKM